MGYYVSLDEADWLIPTKKIGAAYKAMCDLNSCDQLKSGGSYSGGKQTNKWFSWMDENYPETCTDAEAVLQALGFDTEVTYEGLRIESYDNKAGDEDRFIAAIAPFSREGSFLVWRGEDGHLWRNEVKNGIVETQTAKITWQ